MPVSSPEAQTAGVSQSSLLCIHLRGAPIFVFLDLQGLYGLAMKCLLKRLVLKAGSPVGDATKR